MFRNKRLGALIFLCLGSLALGCSDDTGNDPVPDKGVTPDQKVTAPDKGVTPDQKVTAPDKGVAPDAALKDSGKTDTIILDQSTTDQTITNDTSTKKDGASLDTGAKVDQTIIVPDQGGSSGAGCACANPKGVTLSGTKVTVKGDTTSCANQFAKTIKCGSSYDFDGKQQYFKVTLSSGKTYKVTATPTASTFDVALYAFTDTTCTAATINTQCANAYADSAASGKLEKILISPATSATYIIAVDSYSTSTSHAGPFTLVIEEVNVPTNVTCNKAKALTFTSGKASTTGDTTLATNQYSSNIKCGGTTIFDGPQQYYKVTLKANQAYKIALTPTFTAYMYAFQAASCGTATSINTDCGSAGITGAKASSSVLSGKTGAIYMTPTKAGDYVIAVDSTGSTYSGTFTLEVSEFTAATNSKCSAAKAVTFTSGKASIKGDSNGVNDEYASVKCSSYIMDGPQLYYRFSTKADRMYKFTATAANSSSYMYIFKASDCGSAASISTSCSSSGTSGTYVYVSYTTGGTMVFNPGVAGSYIVAMDNTGTAGPGIFTIDIEEKQVATNGTCAKATALTFTSGKASVKGDTTGVNDQYKGSINCGYSSSTFFKGGQVYYSFTATAGKVYGIHLNPSFYSYMYIFPKTSCGDIATINKNCGSKGATGDYLYVSSATTGGNAMYFKPAKTRTYIVAVDSTGTTSSYFGSFTLDLTELNPATNDTCALAKKVTLVAGKATVTDYKVGASNKLAKCGSTTLAATDLFYKFTPVTGKTYRITFKPTNSGGRFGVWDGSHKCVSSAVETACGVLGSSYISGGSSGYLDIKSTSGDIYFVADGLSSSSYDVYGFTFEIAKQ